MKQEDRLTERLTNGVIRRSAVTDDNRGESIISRLARYEDLGTAEELSALQAENAALTERLKNAVELPCNIGDTVYGLPYRSYHKYAVEWKVYAIEVREAEDGSQRIKVYVESNDDIDEFWANSICETIFLTKESATARLKELEGGK